MITETRHFTYNNYRLQPILSLKLWGAFLRFLFACYNVCKSDALGCLLRVF